jgi:hypothetical protein
MIRLHKDFKTFWVASMFSVFSLLGSAVLQLNDYIHQSSVLRDFEQQTASLTDESENLEVQLSSKNSLENFNKNVIDQVSGFEKVEVEKVKYIKASGEQLVKK